MPINVEDLLNNAEVNDIITIPAGVYEVSGANIKVPITLIGEGRVIFQSPITEADTVAFRYSGGSGVTEPMARFHVENIDFYDYTGQGAIEIFPGFLTGAGDTERLSIHGCSFENCTTCIYGAYDEDTEIIGSIDYLDMRDISMRNVDRGIFMSTMFRYCALTDSSVIGATNQAVSIGQATPMSPDPDSEFQNILVDGCDIEDVVNGSVMQAMLLLGHSVKVANSHFKNNKVVPPYGTPVTHNSNYVSVYTKASKVIITNNDFLDAAGIIIKNAPELIDPDNTSEAIITNNIMDSHLVPVLADGTIPIEADEWGVQAISSTGAGSMIVMGNMIFGMEVTIPVVTNRSIFVNNMFFRTPLTKHFGRLGREAIFHESQNRDKHDIRGNVYDPTQQVDTGVFWRPVVKDGFEEES